MRQAWYVACRGKKRGGYRVLVGKPEEQRVLGSLGVDDRITLKPIFKKWDGGHGLDKSGSGLGQAVWSCECGTENTGFIKCRKFLD
jgi:hypothetical protein